MAAIKMKMMQTFFFILFVARSLILKATDVILKTGLSNLGSEILQN